jgi:replication-associated recombination protein RarA
VHEIEPSLRSRADTVKICPVTPAAALKTAQRILQQNGVVRSDADVLRLLAGTAGDWRSILEVLEDTVLAVGDAAQSVC